MPPEALGSDELWNATQAKKNTGDPTESRSPVAEGAKGKANSLALTGLSSLG
jgi:hypothetical protein